MTVEALALAHQGNYRRVLLHREGSMSVICDTVSTYNSRLTNPHEETYEFRSIEWENLDHKMTEHWELLSSLAPDAKYTNYTNIMEAFLALYFAADRYCTYPVERVVSLYED